VRTGSIGIVSLTNSAKSKIDLLPNNYPVVKVRPDCSGYVPGAGLRRFRIFQRSAGR